MEYVNEQFNHQKQSAIQIVNKTQLLSIINRKWRCIKTIQQDKRIHAWKCEQITAFNGFTQDMLDDVKAYYKPTHANPSVSNKSNWESK